MSLRRLNWGRLSQKGAILLRLALGGLFMWTGLTKVEQPYDFLGAVYNYELVGPRMGLWIATLVPWLEVVVGLSLVSGVCQRGGALLALLLLGVFTVAKTFAVAGGLKIACGCVAG